MRYTQNLLDKHASVSSMVEEFLTHEELPFVLSERYIVLPGFCDAHVHFREPGFFYKETIRSGSLAAAHGGYTAVFTMPNLSPVPDSAETLKVQTDIIARDAVIDVYPYGAITKGENGRELSDMEAMAPSVAGFSDDGRGVQDAEMMRAAMMKAKALDRAIVAHCEDNTLLHGGYIHDGEYARKHGHRGISSESEYAQVERDLLLAKEIGVRYHVCHISTKETVAAIRRAKAEGVDVTCETAPHYLVLTDEDLSEEGRFKMNPPLRSAADRDALIAGVLDGTIDMIATDHAPHTDEEKSRGLEKSPFGIVGLETAFPVMYTYLVKNGILSLEKLVDILCKNPRQRFRLPLRRNDFTVFEIETPYTVDPQDFFSKGKSTPFAGCEVYGKCILTVKDGEVVYREEK